MAHAERCPVCHGTGKVVGNPWPPGSEVTCHGCMGRGWVEINDDLPLDPRTKILPRRQIQEDYKGQPNTSKGFL